MEFFSFDLGGIFVAVVLAPIAWSIKNWVQRASQQRQAEFEQSQRDSEARRLETQERLTLANERQREVLELQEAFDIHESLTTREVFEAMSRAEREPASREYLTQLHRRASHRYEQFDERWPLPPDVQELVRAAVADIARRIPAEAAEAQALFEQKVERKTLAGDRSTFRVDGHVLSKHHTLHAIAVRFAREHGIHTVDDFTREWGAVVTRVIGTSLTPSVFTGRKLLTDPRVGSESYLRRYAPRDRKTLADLGGLELDGTSYLLAWESGVTPAPADIGRVVHLPLIEEFASNPKWHVTEGPRHERD
ncbi:MULTISPECIES: hypothetical protein [unclassified Microbacterium]|uniref:hypothetical protein n=1 Tax=unclassified Microbacterium TaxID=2609290 RepID=UPI001785BD91|nr:MULTISPECIES: hypothetical protein [unclassified Microbacterium]MBD8207465.1 hypothetical protein [Microbacterium sp. CFBP 8801]MBD8477117.1 hypothetical protein [Microbacterium sp. CFBP 8794]MBD8509025.1 hypothetical protein [Microbacterium sp. CFBP 8790]